MHFTEFLFRERRRGSVLNGRRKVGKSPYPADRGRLQPEPEAILNCSEHALHPNLSPKRLRYRAAIEVRRGVQIE